MEANITESIHAHEGCEKWVNEKMKQAFNQIMKILFLPSAAPEMQLKTLMKGTMLGRWRGAPQP